MLFLGKKSINSSCLVFGIDSNFRLLDSITALCIIFDSNWCPHTAFALHSLVLMNN